MLVGVGYDTCIVVSPHVVLHLPLFCSGVFRCPQQDLLRAMPVRPCPHSTLLLLPPPLTQGWLQNLHRAKEEFRAPLKRQMLAALREELLWSSKRCKEFDILYRTDASKDADDKVRRELLEGAASGVYPALPADPACTRACKCAIRQSTRALLSTRQQYTPR